MSQWRESVFEDTAKHSASPTGFPDTFGDPLFFNEPVALRWIISEYIRPMNMVMFQLRISRDSTEGRQCLLVIFQEGRSPCAHWWSEHRSFLGNYTKLFSLLYRHQCCSRLQRAPVLLFGTSYMTLNSGFEDQSLASTWKVGLRLSFSTTEIKCRRTLSYIHWTKIFTLPWIPNSSIRACVRRMAWSAMHASSIGVLSRWNSRIWTPKIQHERSMVTIVLTSYIWKMACKTKMVLSINVTVL